MNLVLSKHEKGENEKCNSFANVTRTPVNRFESQPITIYETAKKK